MSQSKRLNIRARPTTMMMSPSATRSRGDDSRPPGRAALMPTPYVDWASRRCPFPVNPGGPAVNGGFWYNSRPCTTDEYSACCSSCSFRLARRRDLFRTTSRRAARASWNASDRTPWRSSGALRPACIRLTSTTSIARTATLLYLTGIDQDETDPRAHAGQRDATRDPLRPRRRTRAASTGWDTRLTPAEASADSGIPTVMTARAIRAVHRRDVFEARHGWIARPSTPSSSRR